MRQFLASEISEITDRRIDSRVSSGGRAAIRNIPGLWRLRAVSRYVADRLASSHRRRQFRRRFGNGFKCKSYAESLTTGLAGASVQSDISDHLPSIYYFTLVTKPRLLVELGTRGGESTRALLAAANDAGGVLLSIDIENCQRVDTPFRDRWHFVQADDVLFARDGFKEWAKERGVNPTVDVLFIDTSHEFHHTLAEVRAWSTHLSPEATMIFHDTNMGPGVYARLDGSVGRAWDNDRGVIRAIEELIGRKYDERAFFSDRTDKYSVLHFPNCNGLTVIRLLPQN